jgi:hypothetical protein
MKSRAILFALSLMLAAAPLCHAQPYTRLMYDSTVPGTPAATVTTAHPLPVTGTFTATVSGVAQGSATSGQTGGLTQGATTTAAPTYVNSTTNPLSLDLSGNLRTNANVTATVNPTGTSLANSTSVSVALSGSAQSQTLTAASSNVTIAASPDSTGLYFSLAATATTSNFFVPAGCAFTFSGVPACSTVYFIGASAAGKASIFAH